MLQRISRKQVLYQDSLVNMQGAKVLVGTYAQHKCQKHLSSMNGLMTCYSKQNWRFLFNTPRGDFVFESTAHRIKLTSMATCNWLKTQASQSLNKVDVNGNLQFIQNTVKSVKSLKYSEILDFDWLRSHFAMVDAIEKQVPIDINLHATGARAQILFAFLREC